MKLKFRINDPLTLLTPQTGQRKKTEKKGDFVCFSFSGLDDFLPATLFSCRKVLAGCPKVCAPFTRLSPIPFPLCLPYASGPIPWGLGKGRAYLFLPFF